LVESERLFLKKGTKQRCGSTKYHEQMVALTRGWEGAIAQHMKVNKLHPYGLRKGAATHAVSGTTAAPSVPAIARRGEWSMGAVLDCYWHFGSIGDQYLGRILAGLDPNKSSFSILPPHWDLEDPLQNPSVKEAMDVMYGPVLDKYASNPRVNPTGLLLRCLACIVYHSESLFDVASRHPGHDFMKLPILQNRRVLDRLKPLVTLEPTEAGIFFVFPFVCHLYYY